MVECESMRRPRVKIDGEGFYHVVSRIVMKRFLLDDGEKEILLGMIRAAAAFSGVEVYTHAVMSNHFHLLVRVPRRKEVSDAELERRMLALYGPAKFAAVLAKWEKWSKKGQEARVEEEKTRMRARMYDLSQFCKTFKEAYTQDYNRRHENSGTIWEGRFKSILLEGSYRALMTVAGYIHLNPVRARMAENAEGAKNAGYGAACQGDAQARAGLVSLAKRVYSAAEIAWEDARAACSDVIEGAMPEAMGGPLGPPETRGTLETLVTTGTCAMADPVATDAKGRPAGAGSLRELLRRRVAGFLHGGALGGERFLRRVAGALPKRVRRRAAGILDAFGLRAAGGVREAS